MKKSPNSVYVLGSDIGTSGAKSVVLDARGRVCGWAIADYPTLRPCPGWAEQHPEDWFKAFCTTVQRAIEEAGIAPENIATVCVVGITHNAVLLDEGGRVLRPSIIYTDTRSEVQVKSLRDRWGSEVSRRAYNELSPLWTWPQLLWVRENEPGIWRRVRRILFPKDYVRHRIAPSFLTDTIDAVGTLLYNPAEQAWIEDFCTDLGLPPGALPRPVQPCQIVGQVSRDGAAMSGLAPGTPVIAGTTDTAAEMFGAGAVRPGQATVKLATVGRIATIGEGPISDPKFLNYPHVLEGLWYPGTSTKFAASAFAWAGQVFWNHDHQQVDYNLMDQAAATAPPGSGGLIFHPHLAGEFAPYWDPHLRAGFLGVSVNHRRAHFTRAVMEGVGFSMRDALESILATGLDIREIRLIGGGAVSDLWSQIMTDILRREVLVPEGSDAAYGAALLAGVASELFEPEPAFLDGLISFRAHLSPGPAAEVYDELFAIYQEATEAITPVSHRLHDFQTSHADLSS